MKIYFKNIISPSGKSVLGVRVKNIWILNDKTFFKQLISQLKRRCLTKCFIFFENKLEKEIELSQKVKSNKYILVFPYFAHKKNIRVTKANLPPGIIKVDFRGENKYLKLLQKKLKEFFCQWKIFLDKEYADCLNMKILKSFPRHNLLILKKGRFIVCLLDLWDYKKYTYDWNKFISVDWIGYIWISPKIDNNERVLVHKYIKKWLYENMKYNYVAGAVHFFNLRSQKFFKKMGFKPKWIYFSLK